MANNGGRNQGAPNGGMGNNTNEHVEFTVKAEEDLYLTGNENTIRRVTAETNYSCLMLKTQRFSSLFRHYAKYHGLRKDDLEYYFVNGLENEDTPESVQLQRGDTIMVRKRRKPAPPPPAADDEEFFKDMHELLDDEEHMDCVFLVYPDETKPPARISGIGIKRKMGATEDTMDICTKPPSSKIEGEEDNTSPAEPNLMEIRAHKCVLTARADYFKALFRKNMDSESGVKTAFRESSECIIHVGPEFQPRIIHPMLEFLYTNRISSISSLSTNDMLSLLHLSDKWLLRDLKRLVEHELVRSHMDVNTVARMYCGTEDFNAKRLGRACIEFIMENIREVTSNVAFQEEMKHYPHLCIPVLRAAADLIPEPAHKKSRSGDHATNQNTATGGSSTPLASGSKIATASAGISSPVPDSDP